MSNQSNISELTKILLQEVANRPDLIKGITDAGGVGEYLKSIPAPAKSMKQLVIEAKMMCNRENLKQRVRRETAKNKQCQG